MDEKTEKTLPKYNLFSLKIEEQEKGEAMGRERNPSFWNLAGDKTLNSTDKAKSAYRNMNTFLRGS